MTKLDEAKAILQAFGLPPAQQNDISGFTLLALGDVGEHTPWPKARRRSIRIHEILGFTKDRYGRTYAENTRETFRRQALHQFVQATIADRNPDEPALATNSPRTHYALTYPAVRVVRLFGTPRFHKGVAAFQKAHGALVRRYNRERALRAVQVELPEGVVIALSPGPHNEIERAVIRDFRPRFTPNAEILYLGDAEEKMKWSKNEELQAVGFLVTAHDKLPDIVLFDRATNALFLIEVVTSHGPVSPKRFEELETMLKDSKVRRVYVTAFPDMAEFRRHVRDIAWETEVWLAEVPDHMIHFNGEDFLK